MPERAGALPGLPEGPVAMLVTPFRGDGEPDLPGLRGQVELAVDLGATGLALFGLAGEGFKLTDSERESLLDVVATTNAGRLPLVTAVDHGGTRAAARRAERAIRLGSTAIMAMPPTGPPPGPDAVVRHFEVLGEVGAPVVVQDAPAATPVRLPVDLLARLVAAVPAIEGIKVEAPPTAAKVQALRDRLDRRVLLYGGRGGLSHLTELLAGAHGTMVGPAYLDAFTAVWRDFRAGDLAAARARFHRLLPAIAFAEGNDLYAGTQKELLRAAGVIASEEMREPTEAVPAVLQQEWRRIAADLPARLATGRSADPG